MKYNDWPQLTWGLILGCNLTKFKSQKGKSIPQKDRLFNILVATGWYMIWNMRNKRRIQKPGKEFDPSQVHNQWLKAINSILQREQILTNKIKFGPLAIDKQVVLNTWSGLLLDEDSLPDDWTTTGGVLVGILPLKSGVG